MACDACSSSPSAVRMAATSSPLAACLSFSMAAWIGALSLSEILSACSLSSFSIW